MGFDALCPSLLCDCNITIRSSWISAPSICLLIKQQQGCIACWLLGRVTGKYLHSISKKQDLTQCSITSDLTSVLTIKIHVTIIWKKKKKQKQTNQNQLLRSKAIKDHVQLLFSLHYFWPVIFAELPFVWASSPYKSTWCFWEQGKGCRALKGAGDAWTEEQESPLPGPLASVKTLRAKDWFQWKEQKCWNHIRCPNYWSQRWCCMSCLHHLCLWKSTKAQHLAVHAAPYFIGWPIDKGSDILPSTVTLDLRSD